MAMTALAQSYGKGPLPMSIIAESKNVPLRFLEGILLQLKREGILESFRGIDGGYALKRPPETIALSEIIQVTEGSLYFVSCLGCGTETDCEFAWDPSTCGIRRIFSNLHLQIMDKLTKTSLKDLIFPEE